MDPEVTDAAAPSSSPKEILDKQEQTPVDNTKPEVPENAPEETKDDTEAPSSPKEEKEPTPEEPNEKLIQEQVSESEKAEPEVVGETTPAQPENAITENQPAEAEETQPADVEEPQTTDKTQLPVGQSADAPEEEAVPMDISSPTDEVKAEIQTLPEIEMSDAEPAKPEENQNEKPIGMYYADSEAYSNNIETNEVVDTLPNDIVDMEVDMEMSDAAADSPAPVPKIESSSEPAKDVGLPNTDGTSSVVPTADATPTPMAAESSPSTTQAPIVPVFRQVKTEPKPPQPIPKITQTHAIVIPSYAAWFSLTKIHEVEKRSLPEFFNQRNRSKTPDIYTKYRNFMVNTYRLNPAEYLTVTACRRNLIGDVCTIMRVHNFLDKWGIINYQVDVEAMPANVVPPFTGHWNVLHDTPRGLFPFKFYKGQDDPAASTLPGGKSIEAATAAAAATPAATTTNAPPVGTPTNESPKLKKESTSEANPIDPGFGWTKKELLLLLEGVEKYNGDWNAIAGHVGTKERQACILKFLSLSIEDPYLDGKPNGMANGSASEIKKENGNNRLGPLKYDASNIPFSQADHPVMSVVSFLAELVDPKVVAAAADRSIKAIKDTIESQPDEDEKDEKKEKSEEKPKPLASISDKFVEDASTVAFGAIGARSEVIRSQTARQMYTNLFKLVSQQLAKNDTKMKKFNQLEQILEVERRELEREREEVFLDRLALHKKVKNVDNLLMRALQQTQNGSDSGAVRSTLEEASRVINDGAKLALTSNSLVGGAIAVVPEENGNDSTANGSSNANGSKPDVQPVSVELPQTYKFWNI